MGENDTPYQNLQNATRAGLTGKFTALMLIL